MKTEFVKPRRITETGLALTVIVLIVSGVRGVSVTAAEGDLGGDHVAIASDPNNTFLGASRATSLATAASPSGSNPYDGYAFEAQLQGIAKPKREAFLRFSQIGQVDRIAVEEGAWVRTGETLVSLDDRVNAAEVSAARVAAESKAGISQAEVAVRRASRSLQRVREAKLVEASSAFEVDAKQNDYDEAVAVLEQQVELQASLQAQLGLAIAKQSQMTLTAPFEGQVILIAVKQGNSVDNTTNVVHLADLSVLEVEMHLPSQLFGTLEIGETKPLRADIPIGRKIPATIRYVSPVIEPTGGTFLVRFEIDNTAGTLPAGFEVWYR